jgi:hypothetical protein
MCFVGETPQRIRSDKVTSIATTVRTHHRGLAVIGALAALVLAAVALLLVTTTPAQDTHHRLVTGYHFLPQFVRALLGAGRLGS